MDKYLKWVRKKYVEYPLIDLKDFRSNKFQFNLYDLGRMHSLRLWYIQNTPSFHAGLGHVHSLENLHHEINHLYSYKILSRLLALGAAMAFAVFVLGENQAEKKDFSRKFDMKYETQIYSGIDEGGLEEII